MVLGTSHSVDESGVILHGMGQVLVEHVKGSSTVKRMGGVECIEFGVVRKQGLGVLLLNRRILCTKSSQALFFGNREQRG